jgi:acyl carrier protein
MSLEVLRDLIVRIAPRDIERSEVQYDTRLVEDLGLKSLELISLVAVCEEAFRVELIERGDLLSNISTVADVLAFIGKLQ